MDWKDTSKFLKAVPLTESHLSARNLSLRKKMIQPVEISRKRTYVLWTIALASMAVFAILGILVLVYGLVIMSQLQDYIDKEVQERIAQALAEQQATQLNKVAPLSVQAPMNLSERIRSKRRAAKCKSKKRCRKKRNGNSSPTFVHLQGPGRPTYDSDFNFKWGPPHSRLGLSGLQLEPTQSEPTKIKIDHTGVYLVYAQIAVHGKQNDLLEISAANCAHQVIMRRRHTDQVILKSLITQRCLGLSTCHTVQGQAISPLDTKISMGVFHLRAHTELRVNVPAECRADQIYSMNDSYFGVVKLD